MATIIQASINLSNVPKHKVVDGKKGKYLPLTITINDEEDNYGNHGPIIVSQTKEERDSKEQKVYLGNVKVVWTNGNMIDPSSKSKSKPSQNHFNVEDDLPFDV